MSAASPTVLRRAVGIGAAIMTMEGYDLVVFGATAPALLHHRAWGLTVSELGLIGALTPVGMMVGALAVGTVADRIGRRRTALWCLAVVVAGMVISALAPSPEVFSAGRFVVGLGAGALFPAMAPLIVEVAPAARRTVCSATVLAGISIGGAASALVAGTIVADHGFRSAYLLGAALGLALIPLAWRGLPESPSYLVAAESDSAATRRGDLRELFTAGNAAATVGFAAATACSFLLIFGMNTWLPQLMTAAGRSAGGALTYLLLLNIGATVGGLGMAAVADRVGVRRTVLACFAIGAAGIWLLALDLPEWAGLATIFVAGTGVLGVQAQLNVLVATSYPVHIRGTAIGFALGVGRIGAIAGPSLGGLLLSAGVAPGWNFVLFGVPALLGAAIIALLHIPRVVLDPSPATPHPAVQTGLTEAPSTTRSTERR